jgi:integrase
MVIGRYGVLTAEQARDLARAALAQATTVKITGAPDPALAKKITRDIPLFSEWVKEYLKEAKRRTKQPGQIEFHLTRAVAGFGEKRLDEISSAMILRVFSEIGESAPVSANRWLFTAAACFAKAVKAKVIKESPCSGIERYRESPGRRRILTSEEIGRLLDALDGEADVFVRAAVKLCLETGCRIGEALKARWGDFDLKGLQWRLPDPKSGKPQEIEITAHTAAWLEKLPRHGPFVISGADPMKPRPDLKGGWERLRKAAGLPGVHLHDLRRTVSDVLIREKGIHMASQVLRHSDIGVTSAHYSGRTPGERRKAVEEVVLPFVSKKTA